MRLVFLIIAAAALFIRRIIADAALFILIVAAAALFILTAAYVSNATAEPLCYIVVATDAPNPGAVSEHEQHHCWGWEHPANGEGNNTINKIYRAYIAPLRYRKPYPAADLVVYFEKSVDVLKLCSGSAYGCQWGGIQKEPELAANSRTTQKNLSRWR